MNFHVHTSLLVRQRMFFSNFFAFHIERGFEDMQKLETRTLSLENNSGATRERERANHFQPDDQQVPILNPRNLGGGSFQKCDFGNTRYFVMNG